MKILANKESAAAKRPQSRHRTATRSRHSAVAVCLLAAMMFAIKLHGSTNRWNREMFSILSEDKVAELARQLDNGLSPNEEYGSSGSFPEELALPLLSFALHYKAERCASLLLERGASVTRPDGFHKIAIQWAEEAGMATIADTIERLNAETNLLVGLDITNAIKRLFPPGSLITPPADVPLTVVCENEKDFGREMMKYANTFPWPRHFSVLGVSTNGPYPTFEYQMRSDGARMTFGGMLSRHRGFYVITNTWSYEHCFDH